MKVKVGNKIYDSVSQPLMIIITEGERKQITNMNPDNTKYCVYPSSEYWTENDYQKIKEWMNEED